jgi:xanthine dehydrogenase accessory factor
MLITPDGRTVVTIGGGAIELFVVKEAADALSVGQPRTVRRDLLQSGERAVGMDCGGTMEIHIDVVGKRPSLLLVGGGHVNLAIAHAAAMLDFDIVVVENRAEFSSPERFPMARRIYCETHIAEAVRTVIDAPSLDEEASVVIATAGEDLAVLRYVLGTPAGYIGMLGSRRKVARLSRALRDEGAPEEQLRRLHAPVGLDIGAETPGEIAVSILAEILAVRNGRHATPLRRTVEDLTVIRGAGDLATGVAVRLIRSGFPVVCLETAVPTVIRRSVSFAQAVFDGETTVEGIRAVRAENVETTYAILERGDVPVLVDPEARGVDVLKPAVLIDAILAKKNLGTHRGMAPITIALGPGFVAGEDVDAVIETNRGHTLGRVILDGAAEANTGVPGTIGGESERRVVRAPAEGVFRTTAAIGDLVKKGDILGTVGDTPVGSPLSGLVRGLLTDGISVSPRFKIGDVDPRGASVDWKTISDKANAIAGGVLEAMLRLSNRRPVSVPVDVDKLEGGHVE